ncbi:MAG TPA: tetratricopeptide repeat protein [Pirellulales bacterium]|nr:tetratricopeptide repeat protein [Pirellulales bacterium]
MRYLRRWFATRRWLLALGGVVLLPVVALAGRQFAGWPFFGPPASEPRAALAKPTSTSQSQSATAELPRCLEGPVTAALKPAPPKEGYVGSDSCANCHAAIAETYRRHPMYRSAGSVPGEGVPGDGVPGEREVEDFSDPVEIRAKQNFRYQVERCGAQALHHERMVDRGGETIYDMALPVRLFIGSGTRGKTYAVERGGLLFESPVSWYAGKGWNLSPGYERANQRFDRRIGDQCMMCHAGRISAVPDAENTFSEPLLLEAAIGCERCHGPGAEHVARWESGEADAADNDSIVNPARLDPARRESICNQCHLLGKLSVTRYQRTFYDFRPGQLLDDAWTVVVEGTGVRADAVTRAVGTKAVSQVQQMRDSACFRGSGGRLGCSACHDPHGKPDESRQDDFYRARCLACHGERGCSKPAAERAAPPAKNSCVVCHMPRLSAHDIVHASQTDHRVTRFPERGHKSQRTHSPPAELELYDHAEKHLQPWEHARVRGMIALMVSSQRDPLTARDKLGEAEALLTAALPWAPDDVTMLQALAQVMTSQGRPAEARPYVERVLAIRPRDERALQLLAGLCRRSGDTEAADETGRRLLEVNPWLADEQSLRAEALWASKEFERAIERAEAALKVDPALVATRSWLVKAYRKIGDEAASQRHAEIVRRMK